MIRFLKRLMVAILIVVALVVLVPVGINAAVCLSAKPDMVSEEALKAQVLNGGAQAEQASDEFQAIVVLGAGINYDGSPSTVLQDRLDTAISLYEAGVAPSIIMTGDNASASYNEVMAMAKYAIQQGVSRDDIFCDHAGISTYDSMYRLRHVFGVSRCVVVTQEYHLYRALFNAHSFGINAVGVKSDKRYYAGMDEYEQREFFARIKDFVQCLLNAEPEVKSEPVSLDQSGTITQWW